MSRGSLKLILAIAVLPGRGSGTTGIANDCRADGSSVAAARPGADLAYNPLTKAAPTAVKHQSPQGTTLNLWYVGLAVFAITVATHVRVPLLADMGRELGMGPAALGAYVAFFAMGRIVADVPAGRLTDSRPVRSMLAVGAVFASVGGLVAGIAPIALVAFAGSFVIGVGSAWTNTTGISAFAEAPRERRGVAMSGFAAALLVGQAIGPTLGGFAASLWDWRVALLAGAALAGVVAVILVWPRKAGTTIPTARLRDTNGATVAPLVLVAIYLLPAVQFAIGAALIQTLVPIVGDGELGLTVGTIGAAIGVAGLLRLAAALVTGRISDNISRRWALFPGLVLQVASLITFAVFDSLAAWWVAIVLSALGSSAVNVGATVLADLSEGGPLGRRLGMFRLSGDVALFLAPLVTGVLYQVSGRGIALVPLIIFVLFVTALNWMVVPETLPRATG